MFGLINNEKNRGNWLAPVFTSVSWLLLNKPKLTRRHDFVDIMDRIDLAQMLKSAKRTKPEAPTTAMTVLLSYEVERLIANQQKEKAA